MFGPTDKILVLGRSGCGKSFLSKKIQSIYPRVWVIDTLEEYSKKDGYEVLKTFSEFSEKTLEIKKNQTQKYKFAIQMDPEHEETLELYNQIIKVLYYLEDCLVVTEEIQEFTSPHKMPHWLRKAVLTGRHRDMALMFTTQRVGLCNKTLASQCAHVFCGQTFENNDLDYLRGTFGEWTEKLKTIPERHFYHWQPGQKDVVFLKNTLAK